MRALCEVGIWRFLCNPNGCVLRFFLFIFLQSHKAVCISLCIVVCIYKLADCYSAQYSDRDAADHSSVACSRTESFKKTSWQICAVNRSAYGLLYCLRGQFIGIFGKKTALTVRLHPFLFFPISRWMLYRIITDLCRNSHCCKQARRCGGPSQVY